MNRYNGGYNNEVYIENRSHYNLSRVYEELTHLFRTSAREDSTEYEFKAMVK